MGHFRDIFTWDMNYGYAYWPLWARQTGTMLQLIPLLIIPATGVVQSFRYLTRGPPDLFEVHTVYPVVQSSICGVISIFKKKLSKITPF